MLRIQVVALVVLAVVAGCGGASRAGGAEAPASAPPPASALPTTPSRDAVVRAMDAVSGAIASCGQGAHGEVSVTFLFESSGALVEVGINPEISWGSTQPVEGCDPVPSSSGYYDCRRPRAPVPGVDECIVRAARAARLPPFSRASFRVNFPYHY